ncbi:MAG: DUF3299 domain-containing protein [Hydrotalea sp.]|nr:DUF3299 domain-containing protein [Hydrotalea sp.]
MKKIFNRANLRLSLAALLLLSVSLLAPVHHARAASSSNGSVSLQPSDEKKAQQTLPYSQDQFWSLMAKATVSVDEKAQTYRAKFPNDIKKYQGQNLIISGFILPLETTEKFTHFLLTKWTPVCAYHPPGEPTEFIEVTIDKPIAWSEKIIKIEGQFNMSPEQSQGMFFQLKNAKVVQY